MLNIGVFTSNELCAKNICQRISNSRNKHTVFSEYKYSDAKTCNIAIIDIDDLHCGDKLLDDASGLKSMITVVISKNEDELSLFANIFLTKKKPVLDYDIRNWVIAASELVSEEYVPNLEEDRLYNAIGIRTDDIRTIDPEMLQQSKNMFKKHVKEHYDGLSKKELIERFGWGDVSKNNKNTAPKKEQETTIHLDKSNKIDFEKVFLENPLTKYRIKKMTEQNMDIHDIIERLTSITKFDAEKSDFVIDNPSDSYFLKKVAGSESVNREIKDNIRDRTEKTFNRTENIVESKMYNENKGVKERAERLLTPEQIEKLRKLGVKI